MPRVEAFEKYSQEYDNWFNKNEEIYQAEIKALKNVLPKDKSGIEIGVGSARFAIPLNIKIGVEPSKKMAKLAQKRGIEVQRGIAEKLPFYKNLFDFVLMVTTICFVDDILKSFKEAYRVLKKEGFILVGFIDKNSALGKRYQSKKNKSKFYSNASFYSTEEVLYFLKKANFSDFLIKQTVFTDGGCKIDQIKDGYGQGSFVVIKAIK